MSENQQALNHVVSMEDLTVDQVMKLIKRGLNLKTELNFLREQTYRIESLFLRILHEHISLLKWQRLS